MRIALWEARKGESAGGLAGGLGPAPNSGLGALGRRVLGWFRRRSRRPAPLVFAHLAAIFGRLGHEVVCAGDHLDREADLYVFCPSLGSLHAERQAMARVVGELPGVRVLVVGPVASALPEAFDCPGITVVQGEPEQLLWTLNEVLARPDAAVQLGTLEELDRIPLPDWSPFAPGRFRIAREFRRFPTGLVELSRGPRFRDPEAVAEEIRQGAARWGFRSFRFCDPCFGQSAGQVDRLVDLLGRLERPVQFSIQTRPELAPPEMLRALRRVGLTCVRVAVRTPAADEARHREFFAACRAAGVRTAAAFVIGFPQDTTDAIHRVRAYAESLNPTFAEFNLAAFDPSAELCPPAGDGAAGVSFIRLTRPVPAAQHPSLSDRQLRHLQAECVQHFYFRWQYLSDNGPLLWPVLGRLLPGGAARRSGVAA